MALIRDGEEIAPTIAETISVEREGQGTCPPGRKISGGRPPEIMVFW